MARVTVVSLVDDLDGGEADETVSFGIDGKTYEIDLSEKRAAELREIFAPFASAVGRAGGRAPASGRSAARRPGTTRPGTDKERTTAIREWATANGHEIAHRGRIPKTILEAYDNRGSAPAEAVGPVVAAAPVEAPVVEVPVVDVAAEPEAKPKRRTRKKAPVES